MKMRILSRGGWLDLVTILAMILSLAGYISNVGATSLHMCYGQGDVYFNNQCYDCPANAFKCEHYDYSCNPGYGSSTTDVSCTLCEPYALKPKPGKLPCGSMALISLLEKSSGGNPQSISGADGPLWSGQIKILVHGITSIPSTMQIRVVDYDAMSTSDYYLCTDASFDPTSFNTIKCNLPQGLDLSRTGYRINIIDDVGVSGINITSNNPEINEIIKLPENDTHVLLQFRGYILRGLERVDIGPSWSSAPGAIDNDLDDPYGMVFNISVPKMVGTDLPVRLYCKGVLSWPHPMGVHGAQTRLSFDKPEFLSLSQAHVPQSYTGDIILQGSGFYFDVDGTLDGLALVDRESQTLVWLDASLYSIESSSEIKFKLPSAITPYNYYEVLIKSNGQMFYSGLRFFVYAEFKIDFASLKQYGSGLGYPPKLQCRGNHMLFVSTTTKSMGHDLSAMHSNVQVRFEHSNGQTSYCLEAHKLSATKIACMVPPALSPGTVNLVAVLNDQWESTGTAYQLSYGPMQIIQVRAVDPAVRDRGFSTARSGEILEVRGNNFGHCSNSTTEAICNSIEVKIGGQNCEPLVMVTDQLLKCEMPGGVGVSLTVTVSTNGGDQSISKVTLVNYTQPSIESVYPQQHLWKPNDQIEIQAREFGSDVSKLQVKLYELGQPGYIQCTGLELSMSATRQIRCRLPSSLSTTNNGRYYVSLVAGNQESRKSNNPVVFGVYPSTKLSTQGGEKIVVVGRGFTNASKVVIFPSEAAKQADETSKQCESLVVDPSGNFLECQTPAMVGRGNELAVLMDADTSTGLRSINKTEISFRLPVILTLSAERYNEDPDQVIEITGENFGTNPSTQKVYVIFNSMNEQQHLRQLAELKSPTKIHTKRHADMNQGSYFLQVEVGGEKSEFTKNHRFINNNANTAPEHPDLSKSLDQDSSLIIQLLADDVDGDDVVFKIYKMPQMGKLYQYDSKSLTKGIEITQSSLEDLPVVTDDDGFVMYTPSPTRHGHDDFVYYADDQKNLSLPITVNLTIQMVNIAPKFTQESLEIYVGETQLGVSLLGLGKIPLEDQDETTQLVLYASKLPTRGQWYSVDTEGAANPSRIELDASKQGGGVVIPASTQQLTIGYQHDGLGGGYPFDTFQLRANDSNKAQTSKALTVNVIVRCDVGKVNNIWGAESGELCVDCPVGAICSDTGETFPVNKAGYYPVDNATFLPCTPRSACPAGGSFQFEASQFGCSEGYRGDRCGQCSLGYYRSGDECVRCATTELDLRLVIPLVVLGLGCLLGAMILLRRIDLGFMSILITYLQTISVFQQFQLEWPQQVIDMFRVFSVFNLNIDLAAPECFMGDQANGSYELKYFGTLALPLILSGLVIVAVVISRSIKLISPHVMRVVQAVGEKYNQPRANEAASTTTDTSKTLPTESPHSQTDTENKLSIFPSRKANTLSIKSSAIISSHLKKTNTGHLKKANSTSQLSNEPNNKHQTLNLVAPITKHTTNKGSTWMTSISKLGQKFAAVGDDLPPLESSEMKKNKNNTPPLVATIEDLDKLQSQPGLIASLAGAAVFAMKILYLSLSRRSVELFQCVGDGNSGWMFVPEPGRKCFSTTSQDNWWWTLFPYSMAGIAIYIVGIPMLSLYLSVRRMSIINQYITPLNNNKQQPTKAEIFILQITYKKRREFRLEYEYWDVVVMLRKLLLVLCQLFFAQYPGFQAVVLLGVLLGAYLLHRNHQPYNARSLNFLESSTIISSILVLLSGLLFFNGVFYGQNIDVLGSMVIVIVCWSLLLVSWMLVRHVGRMLKENTKITKQQADKSEEEQKEMKETLEAKQPEPELYNSEEEEEYYY
jgi:hypothetical protein